MILDSLNTNKLYYSIGEVAELFDVNTSLIRFWEKEFNIIKPKKNNKGNRLFTKKDLENFEKIYVLVKQKGYTLDGAKKALKSKDQSIFEPTKEEQLISKLEAVKERLLGLKKS